MLEIVPVPAFNDNYLWLVHDKGSGETAVVDEDPADDDRPAGDVTGVVSPTAEAAHSDKS